MLRSQICALTPSLYTGAGDLNLALHMCKSGALAHWTIPAAPRTCFAGAESDKHLTRGTLDRRVLCTATEANVPSGQTERTHSYCHHGEKRKQRQSSGAGWFHRSRGRENREGNASLRLRIGWIAWATATLIFIETPKLQATSKDPLMYKENSRGHRQFNL